MGLLSGLLPFVSIELYLLGIAAAGSGAPWYGSAMIAALASMVGKTAYYGLGRGTFALSLVRRRSRQRTSAPGRGARMVSRFKDTCTRHPRIAGWILLASAIVGLPPFGIIAIVAGTGNFGVAKFVAIGFLGRTIRLGAVAGSLQLVP